MYFQYLHSEKDMVQTPWYYNLNSFHQRMFCAKLGWNCHCGDWEKRCLMLSIYFHPFPYIYFGKLIISFTNRIFYESPEGTSNGLLKSRYTICNPREQIGVRENQLSKSKERITNPWERYNNLLNFFFLHRRNSIFAGMKGLS